ncbi:19094_t:CDS:2, partial [Gigaspora margarita]
MPVLRSQWIRRWCRFINVVSGVVSQLHKRLLTTSFEQVAACHCKVVIVWNRRLCGAVAGVVGGVNFVDCARLIDNFVKD